MVARVQEARIGTNNTPPADGSLLPGQFYLEMGTPTRLWVGVPTSIVASGVKLLMDVDANNTALGLLAPKASPVFTGDPQAPTPLTPDNDTSVATTAFVKAQGYQTAAQVAAAAAPAWNNAGRNLIDNARFNVVRRGPGPWSTHNAYTADRWRLGTLLDTVSVFRNTTQLLANAIGDESALNYLTATFTGNAGATANTYLDQPIETVARISGKTVTVSFWANAGSVIKLGLNLVQEFGTGGSPSPNNFVQATGTAFTLSGTFTRYSTTFAISSLSGKTLGTNGDDFTVLRFSFTSGANSDQSAGFIGVQSGTVNLWGVQLEIGSVMTPLEKPDPQQDLAKCSRFFNVVSATNRGYLPGVYNLACGVTWPVMHHVPTITLNTVGARSNSTGGTGPSLAPYTASHGFFNFTSNAAGDAYVINELYNVSAEP